MSRNQLKKICFTVAKILRVLKHSKTVQASVKSFTVAKILRVLKQTIALSGINFGFTVAKILRVLKLSVDYLPQCYWFYSS